MAAITFWLAFDGGSYGLDSRAVAAIVLWWAAGLTVVLGLWPLARPPRTALVAGALLAAFGAWTGLSILWAESAERAVTELNRVSLFLAVFVVTVLASTRMTLTRWCDGLAIATAGIGVVALGRRLLTPDALPGGDVPDVLLATLTRLGWPLDYWNGLAMFVALGLPLLLRVATSARWAVSRAVAVGVVPALGAALYLTSSRGGFAAAAIGLAVFVLATSRRWTAVGALAAGLGGAALAVAVLLPRDALANDPFEAPEAIGQGRSAAALIVLICVASGAAFWLGGRLLAGVRIPRAAGIALVAAVAVAAVAGIAAAHPVQRFDEFKAPPATFEDEDFIRSHLLSGGGSGRWQFWGSAVDEWQTRPVVGRGAGSYESWWAEHAPFWFFVRDAHSLYLETLGELGLVGLALLLGVFGTGVAAGVMRLRAVADEQRVAVAALLGLVAAYLVAAGIDWMWELTAVTVVAIVALGLLTGPASTAVDAVGEPRRGRRLAIGVAALVAGWILIVAQALPFLSNLEISRSQAAVRADDTDTALDRAEAAQALEPWAASPYLQIALVRETAGDLAGARAAIEDAIERDPLDWRLWLVRTRLETKDGAVAEARESLARAVELNPQSPLFNPPE